MNGFPLLVYPVGNSCPLSCSYCLRRTQKYVPFMSDETLRCLMAQYAEASRKREVFWSGGEPLLAGIDFYKRAFSLQQPGTQNSIQTSGLLIDSEWCDLFVEHDVVIGLSYDGLCGGSRGLGQEGVLEAFEMLRARGAAYSAVCVVSSDNLPIPERIIEDLALRARFVVFIPRKAHTPEQRPGTEPSGPQFREFLRRVWEHVQRMKLDVNIRNLDAAASAWKGRPMVCEQEKACGYAAVTETGDVFPCDHFVEPDWHLGNIHERSLKDIMDGGVMNVFREAKQIEHPTCEACPVKAGCNRGCPKDRWLVNRDYSDLDPMCEARKYCAEITKP